MNTKNNQLSRSTDEKIIREVHRQIEEHHRPISRITVRSVCEAVNINRSTFYAHYRDVYDVVEKVERRMSEMLTTSLLDTIDQTGSITKLFEQVFRFVKEYRQFYQLYFHEMHQSGIIGIAWDMLSERTAHLDYHQFGFENEQEMTYAGAFFVHGLTAILQLWLDNGCVESPEELVQILIRQYSLLPKSFSQF